MLSGRMSDETMTLDKLKQAMDLVADIPPPPFLGSSKLLPADKAFRFHLDRRDYVGAHPDFWAKIPAGTLSGPASLGSVEIVDLDVHTRKRAEFFEAMAVAMRERSGSEPLVAS